MPIFQDDLEHPPPVTDCPGATVPVSLHQQPNMPSLLRRLSEESIRTELCEGPILESPRPSTPESDAAAVTSDRAELIERLKRGESPTWVPNRHVGSPRSAKDTPFAHNITQLESLFNNLPRPTTPRSPRPPSSSSSLLPPASITPEKAGGLREDDERVRDGLSIQRPRSALHSGDFTEDQPRGKQQEAQEEEAAEAEGSNRRTTEFLASRKSWIATSPPRDFSAFQFEGRIPFPAAHDDYRSVPSSLSSSFSSSFVYKPPTSPLVQSESNDDVDLSVPLHSIDIVASPLNVNSRRHTLNSAAILTKRGSSAISSTPTTAVPYVCPPGDARWDLAANACASETQATLFQRGRFSLAACLHGWFLRREYPSRSNVDDAIETTRFYCADWCVGSREMQVQFEVPGPRHVAFPCGILQLRRNITRSRAIRRRAESRSKRKMQTRVAERRIVEDDVAMGDGPAMADGSDHEARRAQRVRRRSGSPRAPPGGSYRIPEKGQIQIVIKNPNKTAVKLFLVPYDLAGMEPGTKTFIRQRSYSAGPIIENAPGLEEAAGSDRPILRYLVHLHICCPAKGRYYLYKSVRIVFANRVPDGKEKLRNETTCPEPRYTPYKPIRVMHPPLSNGSGPAATLAAEKAFRRRSAGFPLGQSLHGLDASDGLSQSPQVTGQGSSPSPFSFSGNNQPVEAIPFALSGRARLGSDISDSTNTTTTTPGILSPQSSQASRPTTKDGWEAHIARYEKLNKGDIGYGGNAFAPSGRGSPGGTEGLLSQRLRSLGVQNQGELPSDSRESPE
ncbi:hypothetical protein Ct61P_10719 [Colletotrichum tofieldiae]|nr:hypothetical protein Ct61P_10719 [Colletotrichum tofieldiae]